MDPPASVDGLLLDENWISTTTGGSLATEVGLLHHPEATHLLFPVIEDVTPWCTLSVSNHVFISARTTQVFVEGRDGRSKAFVKS